MTAEEMVKRFNAQGPSKGPWRAPCPVHKSRGLTLAIYDDGDRTSVHCHAGCSSDDVLAAVGLTWKDCYFIPRTKARREAAGRGAQQAPEPRSVRQASYGLEHGFCGSSPTAIPARTENTT